MELADKDRVIKEQRDQLMQLRTQLKEQPAVRANEHLTAELAELKAANKKLQERLDLLGSGRQDIPEVVEKFKGKSEGKTLGLRIPDMMRQRLLSQAERWSAKTYTQVVLTCVELGLQSLEESADATGSVEAVQGVLGPNDPGPGGYPTAN